MEDQGARYPRTEHPLLETNNRLLTVSQAARLLNAHPNSVRHWADSGLLPVFRIGRRGDRRFRAKDVAEFIAAREESGGG